MVRTGSGLLSEWNGTKTKSSEATESIIKERKAKEQKIKLKRAQTKIPWEKKVKCPHCPGLFANEMKKFIGYTGYEDKQGICHLVRGGQEHHGEAFPAPVDKNRVYLGVLGYEIEIMTLMFLLTNIYGDKTAIAILMPRGHGKTYMNAWMDQFYLKYFQQNIMMLSETNARLKVGNWIYVWALRNDYLKDPEQFARKNTYHHFELVNGSRMDIYKFMKEDLVGEHNYILSLDDVVKRNWKHKPTDNERAIEHWSSNVNYIMRAALYIYGTRKFEGDPLQHMIETIDELIVIKKSPFIACPHDNKNEDGTYDPCDICRDDALLAPELHTYDGLIKKMKENYESWYAEMMQNPHPMEGGMVDKQDLMWINRPYHSEVQMVGIGVDSTENELDSHDMVGIVSCVMGEEYNERDKPTGSPLFTFTEADVRKMPYESFEDKDGVFHKGIMNTISEQVKFLELNYPGKVLIVAIERQGGGLYIIKEARKNPTRWWWVKYLIGDRDKSKKKFQDENAIGILHTTEKKTRVFSELRHPIKKHQVRFAHNLAGSVFVKQVCSFPKGKFDDGPDAGGTIKDELYKRFAPAYHRRPRKTALEKIREKQRKNAWELQRAPWEAQKRSAIRNQQIQAKNKSRLQ